jgi:hypothetical protein
VVIIILKLKDLLTLTVIHYTLEINSLLQWNRTLEEPVLAQTKSEYLKGCREFDTVFGRAHFLALS